MTVRVDPERARRVFLLGLVLGISLLFLFMVRRFLLPVFLAAIFTGLMYPLYTRIARRLGDRKSWAAIVTLLFVLVVIVVPLTFFGGIVTAQAVQITERVRPFVQEHMASADMLHALF
jgi:predicted PurR-regulated permease PerM